MTKKISRLTTLSRVYINRKHFFKARPLCVECYRCAKQCLSASRTLQTSDSSDSQTLIQSLVCEAASRLALVHDELKEFDLAKTLHEEILEISVRVHGPENAHTWNARHCFAVHLRISGSYVTALQFAESVLQFRKQSAEASQGALLEVANSEELLGLIHEDLLQFDRAASFHQRALDIRQQQLTCDHVCTWSSMNSMARILLQQDAPAQAEICFRQVYESTTRVLGELDSVALTAAEKLAGCLKVQDSHAAALTLQLKILHGHRAISSIDNAEVVIALGNVAASYCSLGKRRVIHASMIASETGYHINADIPGRT